MEQKYWCHWPRLRILALLLFIHSHESIHTSTVCIINRWNNNKIKRCCMWWKAFKYFKLPSISLKLSCLKDVWSGKLRTVRKRQNETFDVNSSKLPIEYAALNFNSPFAYTQCCYRQRLHSSRGEHTAVRRTIRIHHPSTSRISKLGL